MNTFVLVLKELLFKTYSLLRITLNIYMYSRISRTIQDFSEGFWKGNFTKKIYPCVSFVQPAKKLLVLSNPS